jgi:general bacterial porin, GBP family
MNKKLVAAASLAMLSATAAQAQGSVELYGILDVGVGTVNNQLNGSSTFPATVNPVSANTAKNSWTGMFNGGISPSRWGIRGSEDLGGGLKAIFTLEEGFNAPTGAVSDALGAQIAGGTNAANSSIDGQMFNRQAWVGLSSATAGTVTFGRNYAPIFDIVVAYDPVQAAQLFSPLGFSGTIGGGGGVSESTRQDNSVKYTNKFGNFNATAMYKFGNQAGSTSAQSAMGLGLGYESGPLGIQFAYQTATDAIKTTASGGAAAATAYNTEAYFVAAKYAFSEAFRVRAGYEKYTLKAASDNINGVVTSVYNYTVPAANATSYTSLDQPVAVYFVGADYDITSAFNLAGGYYVQNPQAYSTKIGVKNTTLSLLADYRFSKRTDAYAGYMNTSFSDTSSGANSPNNGKNSSISIFGVGIRHRF